MASQETCKYYASKSRNPEIKSLKVKIRGQPSCEFD